jgi:transposase-like protein
LTEKKTKKEENMSRQTIRYSNYFKRNIVEAIERDGLSIEEMRRRYGIKGGQTVQKWLRTFGKNQLLNKVVMVQTLEERDELKYLREENKRLKVAYAELVIAQKINQKTLEIADEMYGLDLKKSTDKRYHSA